MTVRALIFLLFLPALAVAEDASFHRAINLNGPALMIDGRRWEASQGAKDFSFQGKTFENQTVVLKPAASGPRAQMIRSSVWGDKVDLKFERVPVGVCQVFLYVWEDNNNERFDVVVNDKVVVEGFQSGTTGMWKRLGPFATESREGRLTVGARGPGHGAANLSGVEVWLGSGAVPAPEGGAKFAANPTPEQVEFFEKRIRPVLAENCYECHSATAKKLKGGLLLDSRAGVQKGGDTGPAITPGDTDASLLIQAVRHASADLAMPPKKKLPPEVIANLEAWVKAGAPDPRTEDTLAAMQSKTSIDWNKAREWWSFRPLTSPPVPAVKDTAWPRNDVDRFILAKLEAANLQPAPDAEPRALIRRMSFDLTGLPPSPEEVEKFTSTFSPSTLNTQPGEAKQANLSPGYLSQLSTLLASPRYGETWGRHWLDVVRYADTAGDNSDFPIPQIRLYRDWVIDSFNNDLPYDEFVRDQIAGDLLGGEGKARLDHLVATGYVANSRRFGSRVDDYPQHLTIEDTIDSLGRTFLGLSLNCARCHDHKFDPIPTKDYYAIYGIFASTRYPWPGIELEQRQRDFVPLVEPDKMPEMEKAKKAREDEIGKAEKSLQKLKDELKSVPSDQKKTHQEKIKAAEKTVAEAKSKPKPYQLAYAVAESGKIADAVQQMKGDPAKPGDLVKRHWLTVFGGQTLAADDTSSGRRALAEWIVSRDNPLTARVIANRVWHYHFGRGLVPTPNDFGKQGKPCTHPELLDYLAAKLRDSGWSLKALHREIMSSRTYQLATARSAASIERDPSNELLSSFPRRRLDAESLRDTILLLGGTLDLTRPGEHPFPPESEWKFTQHNPFKAVYESNHRSVYLMTQRIQRHPFLAVFDGADPSTSTPARAGSTTPLQALFFLNDPMVHGQSRRLAERILKASPELAARIQRAYQLILCRPAADDEIKAAEQFLATARGKLEKAGTPPDKLEKEAWASLMRVYLRLNEFLYPD